MVKKKKRMKVERMTCVKAWTRRVRSGLINLESQVYAPTTLPAEILALLTSPSPRAIIIVIEEFDLFTDHARQALLYCLCEFCRPGTLTPVLTLGRSGRCAKH